MSKITLTTNMIVSFICFCGAPIFSFSIIFCGAAVISHIFQDERKDTGLATAFWITLESNTFYNRKKSILIVPHKNSWFWNQPSLFSFVGISSIDCFCVWWSFTSFLSSKILSRASSWLDLTLFQTSLGLVQFMLYHGTRVGMSGKKSSGSSYSE